ncbi:MAG: hypothetical protein KDD48_02065 [Bdellovibrionales bacterium]|nr:hypothetical protein [Bdellovibrionales bacterium]
MLKQAEVEVKNHNYKTAIDLTLPLLDALKLSTVEEISQGHKILGIARCELGDIGNAKEHFETLVVFSPKESIQDFQLSQVCQKLFNKVMGRAEVRRKGVMPKNSDQLHSSENKSATIEIQTVPKPTINLRLQEQSQESDIQKWKLWIPFGVGQFEKNEKKKGTFFLTTQSVLFSTAITTFILFKIDQNADGTFDHARRAETYRITLWSSLGAGVVSTIWGIWDAKK